MKRAILALDGATLKRRASFALPLAGLHRKSRETLQAQLCGLLRAAIAELPAGSRLPSTRSLAKQLGVSRNTVLNVYEDLVLEGVLAAKTGSGTRVSGASPSLSRLNVRRALRESQYPAGAVPFRDPDGHAIYLHR